MKVLVTGAAGFLGSHLTQALGEEGYEVYAVVRPSSDLSGLRNSVCKVTYADLSHLDELRTNLPPGLQVVFHLAGSVALRPSERLNLDRVHLKGTHNVIRVCQEFKVPRLVHISSVAAIGASRSGEILSEESPNSFQKYRFPNYEIKARAEALVLEEVRGGRLDAVVINPSVIFGARDLRKPARKASLMAAQGKLPFYTQGGLSVAPVEDVVQGIIQAWKKGRKGERYILSGENLTGKEVAELYARASGARPPSRALPSWLLRFLGSLSDWVGLDSSLNSESAMTATTYHWFDHSKATRELDYRPRPAREAIKNSVDWLIESRTYPPKN